MSRRLAAALVSLTSLLLVSGCSNAADKASEKAVEKQIEKQAADNGEDVDVNVDEGQVTVDSSDGTMTIGKDELPDGFPIDEVPLLDGKIIMGMAAEGEGWTVAIQVDGDDVSGAVKAAADKLKAAGFTEDASGMTMQDMAVMKNDKYSVVMNGTSTTGQAVVSYVVAKV